MAQNLTVSGYSNYKKVNINVKNGILHFKNIKDYKSVLLRLQSMDIEQILDWERSMHFTSLYSRFQEIIEAEWNHEGDGHSQAYMDYLEKKMIRKINDSYELNIFNPAYSYILNGMAMVMISNNIYQMTANGLKIWYGGNPNDIETLHNTLVESHYIKFIPIEFQSSTLNNEKESWNKMCKQVGGESRFYMEGRYYSSNHNINIDDIIFINYLVIAKTEIKSENIWKIDPWAFVQIRGYSLYKTKYNQDDHEKWRITYGSYDVSAEGGYRIVIPAESEETISESKLGLMQTVELEEAVWRASSKSLSDEWLSCAISTK